MHRHIGIRVVAVILAAGAVGYALSSAVIAQETGQVYAYVMSQTGQPVTDLTVEEFSVTEDDVETEVVSAQIGTDPMKVALLVDNGQGLEDDVTQFRAGASAFIRALPFEHAVGIYTIGGQVQRRTDFLTDKAELLDAADGIFPDRGNTRLLDGVRETWDRRYEGDEAWPVIVIILTDGTEDSAFMNDNRFLEWINGVRQGGLIVHVIQVTTRGGSPLTNLALNLTQNTGGRYVSIASATALDGALTTLATDMAALYEEASNRYRVVFERADPPGASISLSVSRPGVGVRLFGGREIDP